MSKQTKLNKGELPQWTLNIVHQPAAGEGGTLSLTKGRNDAPLGSLASQIWFFHIRKGRGENKKNMGNWGMKGGEGRTASQNTWSELGGLRVLGGLGESHWLAGHPMWDQGVTQ